mmetsp:Transcript_68746/g.201307  ORF Transcript_68746/g.201307 Transcript_68746/m.201307 type:complete len:694 (-) Transcript_68746:195-2276(-)
MVRFTSSAKMLACLVARLSLWLLLLPLRAGGKEYAKSYTFLADRLECDGQCTYCRHSHNHHRWAELRMKLSSYVHRAQEEPGSEAERLAIVEHLQMQRLINWSWEKGVRYECIIGIIAMRMLSYGYSNPMQFHEGEDFDVLDFLDTFNSHTGALDLLTSSWAALLAGGWPVFREFYLISRKVQDRMSDSDERYAKIQERPNECDDKDQAADIAYRDDLREALAKGTVPHASLHLAALSRGLACPAGRAVALLSMALDFVRNRGMYQGSLKDPTNLVYGLISTAQDTIVAWTRTKSNWSPFFDLLTTRWPLWEVLSQLACVDTNRPCASRSAQRCFDPVQRQEVPCPHAPPRLRRNFAACGEHDICTWPPELNVTEWCVPFGQRPAVPREPFLLWLGHDEEERICSQCGQDGVLRAIFDHIGFRDAAGPALDGGRPPFYVEFGARKPGMLNSAVLRQFCGWEGVLLDGQPGETPHGGCPGCPGVAEIVHKEFVTAENVVELFMKYTVPRDFDLLTIDIDYNDYWILRALLTNGTFRPRVVALDFNPDHPIDVAKVVQYEAEAEWDGSVYTVASLLAYSLLAKAHGYAFAYALEMGAHAFFVREDLLAEQDRALPLRNVAKASHPPDASHRNFVDVLYDYVPDERSGGADAAASGNISSDRGELAALRQEVRDLASEVRSLRSLLSQQLAGGGSA